MEQHTYISLKSLNDSDFKIVDGEPDIIGWNVNNETGTYLGKIKDLLYDPQSNAVRYLIIDLNDNGMGFGNKKVMIPIGIAHLHIKEDQVELPNVHQEQFNALPNYIDGEIGPDTEIQVREIIGSPAALRIAEKTVELDQQQFYSHQHFNKENFYQRGGDPNRVQQQETIHEMVENSKANDFHAADDETGSGTHHNEHAIKPWLAPGANHNQRADENKHGEIDYLDNNKPPYSPE